MIEVEPSHVAPAADIKTKLLSEPKPLRLQVDYENFGSSEQPTYLSTVSRPDGSRLSYVVLNDEAPEYRKQDKRDSAAAVVKAGYFAKMLPAHGDKFSEDEAAFYQEELGATRSEIAHPFLHRDRHKNIGNREVVFFHPTVTSVLDLMRLAGHDSPEISEMRKAALHGENNTTVEALSLLLSLAKAKSRQLEGQPVTNNEKTLQEVFETNIELGSAVAGLCQNGLENYELRHIKEMLDKGVDPDLITQIATGDEGVKELVKTNLDHALETAQKYHHSKKGIYTELHRVGKQIVPLIALTPTDYENAQFAQVDETSGHNLAQIHQVTFENPGSFKDEDLIRNNNIAILGQRLGLDAATLVMRGRMHVINGAPVFSFADGMRGTEGDITEKPAVQSAIAGLARMGVRSKFRGTQAVTEIGLHDSGEIGTVQNDIQHVWLPADQRGSRREPIMILQGIASTEELSKQTDVQGDFLQESDRVTLSWAEARAKFHQGLYSAVGANFQATFELSPGSGVELGGYLNWLTDDAGKEKPELFFLINGTDRSVHAASGNIQKIAEKARIDVEEYLKSYGITDEKVTYRLLSRDPDVSKLWAPVEIKSTDTSE